MSRFVNRQATDEITLSNGDRVQVRQRLAAAEDAELTRCLMRLKVDASTGKVDVQEGDWHLQRLVVIKAYVVGWDFKDDEGKPVPFDPTLIDDLDGDTIDEIARAIDAQQKARKEASEKKVRST